MTQRVTIDWDDLEIALTMQSGELSSFLKKPARSSWPPMTLLAVTRDCRRNRSKPASPRDPYFYRTSFITNGASLDG
jgi:hypothetical protein